MYHQPTVKEKRIIARDGWIKVNTGKGILSEKKYMKISTTANKNEKTIAKPLSSPTTSLANISQKDLANMTPQEIVQNFIKNLPPTSTPKQIQDQAEQLMNLVMQLGSDTSFLRRGQIDERKLANINAFDQLSLGHFNYRAIVDGIRYYGLFVDWILVTSNAIGGLRARQVIQLVGAYSGGQTTEYVQEPGWVGRNLTNRDWEDKARAKGQTIIAK